MLRENTDGILFKQCLVAARLLGSFEIIWWICSKFTRLLTKDAYSSLRFRCGCSRELLEFSNSFTNATGSLSTTRNAAPASLQWLCFIQNFVESGWSEWSLLCRLSIKQASFSFEDRANVWLRILNCQYYRSRWKARFSPPTLSNLCWARLSLG